MTADRTTDTCQCGATYATPDDMQPDPDLYGTWMDHHLPHNPQEPE